MCHGNQGPLPPHPSPPCPEQDKCAVRLGDASVEVQQGRPDVEALLGAAASEAGTSSVVGVYAGGELALLLPAATFWAWHGMLLPSSLGNAQACACLHSERPFRPAPLPQARRPSCGPCTLLWPASTAAGRAPTWTCTGRLWSCDRAPCHKIYSEGLAPGHGCGATACIAALLCFVPPLKPPSCFHSCTLFTCQTLQPLLEPFFHFSVPAACSRVRIIPGVRVVTALCHPVYPPVPFFRAALCSRRAVRRPFFSRASGCVTVYMRVHTRPV